MNGKFVLPTPPSVGDKVHHVDGTLWHVRAVDTEGKRYYVMARTFFDGAWSYELFRDTAFLAGLVRIDVPVVTRRARVDRP